MTDAPVAETPPQLAVRFADIQAAAARLAGNAHVTPVFHSTAVDGRAYREVWFKCEQFQRTGSFKFRGAYNALAVLDDATRARGVIAFSSGNHAQAVALAARVFGVPAVIVMPSDAPPIKVEATKGYGADVVLYDRLTEDREAIARRLAEERGLTVIPPFNHAPVIAGQGTLAIEFLRQVPNLEVILAPVGGGGLISGIAVAAKAIKPDIRVFGVETERANDAQRSLRLGEIVHIAPPDTIADGIRTQAIGTLTFPIMRSLLEDIVTVSEEEVREALRFLLLRAKLVAEPTGAVGAAAVLNGKIPGAPGERVGVVLSGGNADPAVLAEILSEPSTFS